MNISCSCGCGKDIKLKKIYFEKPDRNSVKFDEKWFIRGHEKKESEKFIENFKKKVLRLNDLQNEIIPLKDETNKMRKIIKKNKWVEGY